MSEPFLRIPEDKRAYPMLLAERAFEQHHTTRGLIEEELKGNVDWKLWFLFMFLCVDVR